MYDHVSIDEKRKLVLEFIDKNYKYIRWNLIIKKNKMKNDVFYRYRTKNRKFSDDEIEILYQLFLGMGMYKRFDDVEYD